MNNSIIRGVHGVDKFMFTAKDGHEISKNIVDGKLTGHPMNVDEGIDRIRDVAHLLIRSHVVVVISTGFETVVYSRTSDGLRPREATISLTALRRSGSTARRSWIVCAP